MRTIKFSLVHVFFITFGFVTGSNLEFEHLNSNNGLSSEEIRDIFQDSRGYIWFLTPNGLNRYDGYEMRIFNSGSETLNFSSNSFDA